MFVDLAGSTPLVRELGPAAADRVMSAVVQRLADTVERLGAEIERPLGDGVLVHWRSGEPADQVSRCLEAISRLRAAVIDVPIPGLPMGFLPRLTFGIEHGRIVGSPVTIRGLPQWMSSGETVHLAARLQSLCGSLEQDCLVGPVAGLLAGEDRVRPVSEVEVKGFGTVVVFAPR
jgi:class 3 adenylate cyclase